jgi:UDP-N-acetylglucosamine 2-epimerase (non-hydrolysing)
MTVTRAGGRTKIVHVVGARPNYMKTAPLMRQMAHHPGAFEQVLVHTGQHYDYRMSEVFFEHLGMPQPDVHLGVGSGSHAQQTARVMQAFEPVLLERRPDWVVVVGDVNSTLACALTAAKLGLRVAHVEAGLRSFDRTMPEETNRVLTDQVSDLLFTPSSEANENLRRERIPTERIRLVGNVMIDTLVALLPEAARRWPSVQTQFHLRDGEPFVLVTLHRPSNVDEPEVLRELMRALAQVARRATVVFPVHPRTQERLGTLGLGEAAMSGVQLIEPLGYLDFLALQRHAAAVVTDSGGVQEETTYLGVPCLTVRPNTERPVTITRGTNRLVPSEAGAIVSGVTEILDRPQRASRRYTRPELWDGHAAERIVEVFLGEAGMGTVAGVQARVGA